MTDDKSRDPVDETVATSDASEETGPDPTVVRDESTPSAPEPMNEEATRPGTRGSRVVPAPVSPPDSDPSFELGELPATDSDEGPYRSSSARQSSVWAILPWLLLVLAIVSAAFVVVRLYLPSLEEIEKKTGELEAARKGAVILQRQVETLEGLHRELAAKVEEREKEVQALQATQDELAEKLQKEIQKGNVAISQARGELVVDLIDKVLFDSGEAELNEKGAEVLLQVGETLLKVPDKVIQVTGHTDSMGISEKLIDKFPTNWELSAHRATNVVRFLQEQAKVPGERLAAVGRSQYYPIASNATSKGRRRNRRIEVTLLPVPKKR